MRGAVEGVVELEVLLVELARLHMELLLFEVGKLGRMVGEVASGELELSTRNSEEAARVLRLPELWELTTLLGLKALRSSLIKRRLSEI